MIVKHFNSKTGEQRIEFLPDKGPLQIAPETLMEEIARLRALAEELAGQLTGMMDIVARYAPAAKIDCDGNFADAEAALAKAREVAP